MVASLALLVILQSTNLWKEFSIESSSDLLLLYALSSLNFVAFVIFAFIFLRSIIKLVRERRTFELGAKIKTRLLIYFFAVSLLPIIAMAVFSYLFMNRALERWFTQIPENVINQTRQLQQESIADRTVKLNGSARMIAAVLERLPLSEYDLDEIATLGNLSYIEIVDSRDQGTASYTKPLLPEQRLELDPLLALARSRTPDSPVLRDGKGFDVAVAPMSGGRRLLIVPDPYSEEGVSQLVDQSVAEFERLKEKQVTVRQVGLLTLGMLTFLLIFASSWIAFYVARGLTTPIKALAEGANEIARGHLGSRVEVLAEDELALLVTAFNEMASKLEENSAELSERRRYIETLLDTLPNGVVSFDADNRISTINHAAKSIFQISDEKGIDAESLGSLITDENRPSIERLISRARRVGHASDQTTLSRKAPNGSLSDDDLTVALTAAKLPYADGVVLVIEDLSELISAQRASAWQEVARRMAHEIKNPLTPIQLSAERIAKRFTDANGEGNSAFGEVVTESTATILREVTSLKSMVNEFSRFARMPDVRLEPGNVNDVVVDAVAAFDGRSVRLFIEPQLDDDLPDISLDPEQLKRVFVNLMQNSAEAVNGEAGKLTIRTRHDNARGLIVAEVADNGTGIASGDLQKLFQPYFSTKGRGTGLGLAIVRRIIAEHHGRINVVANQPHGAKFIIELPVG
jgi:two-component system, NtrC family, nitrogen regulation sensor histidine kinase NtrY